MNSGERFDRLDRSLETLTQCLLELRKQILPSLQSARKELEETAIVMSGIQARQAAMLKEHAEWLQEHDRAMTEARERGRTIDERIAALVSAIGELVRRNGGQ